MAAIHPSLVLDGVYKELVKVPIYEVAQFGVRPNGVFELRDQAPATVIVKLPFGLAQILVAAFVQKYV